MHKVIAASTDLPVLNLPALKRLDSDVPGYELSLTHGAVLAAVFIASIGIAEAQSAGGHPSILATLWKWLPLMLKGFVFNIAISFLAMAIGTFFGMFLGLAQISLLRP